MAGGWMSITDRQGRFTGARTIETGGDAEEMARDVFGMMWWLAAQLAVQETIESPVMRAVALRWISVATEHVTEGAMLGGLAEGDAEH